MRKFIAELFTNRFGIVLAALNLCFFASRFRYFYDLPFGKIFLYANFPAAGSTILALDFVRTFIYKFPPRTENDLVGVFFAVFIVLQWLLIAWVARTFARNLCPRKL